MSNQPRNYQVKTRNLTMPIDANQVYGLSEQSWKVLTEVTDVSTLSRTHG